MNDRHRIYLRRTSPGASMVCRNIDAPREPTQRF
jgi:hypothetical protein